MEDGSYTDILDGQSLFDCKYVIGYERNQVYDDDEYTPKGMALADFQSSIETLFFEFENVTHWAFLEKPEVYHRKILTFLKSA